MLYRGKYFTTARAVKSSTWKQSEHKSAVNFVMAIERGIRRTGSRAGSGMTSIGLTIEP